MVRVCVLQSLLTVYEYFPPVMVSGTRARSHDPEVAQLGNASVADKETAWLKKDTTLLS